MEMELVISNSGQMRRMTPEPIFYSPNFGITPYMRTFELRLCPVHSLSSVVPGSNSWHTSQESVKLTTRLPQDQGIIDAMVSGLELGTRQRRPTTPWQ
ncbi:hypothetical protein TNCV_1485641 [Trichonephila clavipes]|nr:hypothetical protein TNCV_1485641 [Trichonephila clavipes]